MATFRIYFFGLICHASDNDSQTEKDFAVAVDAPGHFRFLRTETKGQALKSFEKVRFKFRGNYDPGHARVEQLFMAHVPQLRPLMGGRLDRPNIPQLGTEIEYPASRDGGDERPSSLTVAHLYRYQAVHIGRGKVLRRLGCIARLTELTVERPDDTEMDVVVVRRNGDEDPVDTVGDGTCVLISNATVRGAGPLILLTARDSEEAKNDFERLEKESAHGGHAHQHGEHARHYGSILREENDFVLVAEDEGAAECSLDTLHCDWLRRLLQALIDNRNLTSTHAECGNTSWP